MKTKLTEVLARSSRSGALWLILFAVSGMTLLRVNLGVPDGAGYFAQLRSTYYDRDVHLANEYERLGVKKEYAQVLASGYQASLFQCGTAVLWMPFVAAADIALLATGPIGPGEHDGFGGAYYLACDAATLAYAIATVILLFLISRRVLGGDFRTLGPPVTAAVVGTPFLFYAVFQGGMSHVPAAFTVALTLWLWIDARGRDWPWSRVVLIGLAAGLACLVRLQEGVFLAVVVVDLLWQRRAAGASRALALAAIAAAVFTPQLMIWNTLYGSFFAVPQGTEAFHWTSPAVGGVLFSPFHGALWWTPTLLLSIPGLVLMARRSRLAALLAVAFAAQIYIDSTHHWWGGLSFGPRRLTDCTAIAALGLGAGLSFLREKLSNRWLYRGGVALLAAAALWSLALACQVRLGALPHQDYTPPEMILRAEASFFTSSAAGELLAEPGPLTHVGRALMGEDAPEGLIRARFQPDDQPAPLSPWYVAALLLLALGLPLAAARWPRRFGRPLLIGGLATLVAAGAYVGHCTFRDLDPWSVYPPSLIEAFERAKNLREQEERSGAEEGELADILARYHDLRPALAHARRALAAERTPGNRARAAALQIYLREWDGIEDLVGNESDPMARELTALGLYADGIEPGGVERALEILADEAVRQRDPDAMYRRLVVGHLRLGRPEEAARWAAEWERKGEDQREIKASLEPLRRLYPRESAARGL